jgi:hypothetical protein
MTFKSEITQSSYIQWNEFFDSVRMVDVFLFYDFIKLTNNRLEKSEFFKYSDGTL